MISGIGLALLGVLLCVLPLASLLGYESAAVMGAAAGLVVMGSTLRRFSDGRLRLPLDPASPQGPAAVFFTRLPANLALLVAPALLLTLNALRVPNCDLWLGVQFWLVIPAVSVVIGQTIAFAVAVLPRLRGLAALAVLLAEIARVLWRLVWHPSITGHEWLIGYFSGSIYDEALSLPTPLLWYRLMLLAGCGAVVLALEAAWRWRTGRPVGPVLVGLSAAGLVALSISTNRMALDIEIDRDEAIEILSGHLETEHFIIHFDPAAIPPERQPLIAADHEFHYDRHVAFFGFDPVEWRGRKMTTFVYPDRSTQKRILGARSTQVARPWTHEMHIRWSRLGAGSLGHEMSHLFSAQIGAGPLQLPTRGGLTPDIGLLEGIAEAADWPAEELPAHHAVAAMRRLDIAPDLRLIFKPTGFWSQPSGKAYTMMGSFVRYLFETYGIEKLKAVYGAGDFEGTYGREVTALISEWEGFVDAIALTEADLQLARTRYSRRSIFERVCARTIAEQRRQADIATVRGEYDRAQSIWETIIGFESGSADHRLSLAGVLSQSGDHAAALTQVDDLLTWDLSEGKAAQVSELRGDLLWHSGRRSEAAAAYVESLTAGLSDAARRRLEVKRLMTTGPSTEATALAQSYLLGGLDRSTALYTVMQWAALDETDPLPRYLTGLLLTGMEKPDEAARWLDHDPTLSSPALPVRALEEQRQLLHADAKRLSGSLAEAAAGYSALLDSDSHRIARLAELGLQRTAWRRSRQ
ncbi:MAG: tetratricopeptide repeat protein [Myxococcota bacterium]|nr:tetratricopeptide repeat protein [Myxococcota bacterium]